MFKYLKSFQSANKYTKSFVLATIAMTIMVLLTWLWAYVHVVVNRTESVQPPATYSQGPQR